jgi:putative glutamine amidotransferase
MKRPRIGVTTSVRGSLLSWLFNAFAVWRAGGKPLRLTAERPEPMETLDGLIVGGGDDISASLYGGKLIPEVRFDERRDRLETSLLDHAKDTAIPVLGICRGAQMLNIHRGGTLHQEITEIWPEAPRGRMLLPRKRIFIDKDSRLSDILRCNPCRVNSIHHQAIDKLGADLRVVAEDRHGIVQAIERQDDGRFLLGVQWHPEYLPFSKPQFRIIKALVKAAASRNQPG